MFVCVAYLAFSVLSSLISVETSGGEEIILYMLHYIHWGHTSCIPYIR